MRYFLSVLLFFSLYATLAQHQRKSDSLYTILSELSSKNESFSNDTTLVQIYSQIGQEYARIKNDSATVFWQRALAIAEQRNYKAGIVKVCIQLGKYYHAQYLPVRSSEYCLKALAIAEELKIPNELKYLNARLGGNYMLMNDFGNAIIYYQKHSAICKNNGKPEEYLLSLNNLGVVHFEAKNYNKALYYFEQCEKLNSETKSPKVQNAALINIGKTLVKLGNYEQALARFQQALTVNDGYNDKQAFVNNEIAQVYFLQKEYNEALKYASIALQNLAPTNQLMHRDVAKTLADIYERTGNTQLAYKYYKDYSRIMLSEDSIKNSQLLRFLKLDYETEKNNQKITALNLDIKEKESRSRLLGVGLIALLVGVIIVVIYSQSLADKNRLIQIQKADIEQLNESLENKVAERTKELTLANEELLEKNREISEALFKGKTIERERVANELHDNLGGMLSALKWRFEALDSENLSTKEQEIYNGILKTIHKAYEEVRRISHNMLPAELAEKGLVGALEKFVQDLNNAPAGIAFTFKADNIDELIRQDIALELYSCCLEAISNIIKHADANQVSLTMQVNARQELEMSILDNGKGFINISGKAGKGLKNIDTRVKGIPAKFEINTLKTQGTQLLIVVPEFLWKNNL